MYYPPNTSRLLLINLKGFKTLSLISSIIKSHPNMAPEDIFTLEVSLINLVHKCYCGRADLFDIVLHNTKDLFINADVYVVRHRTPADRELEKLLRVPIGDYNDVMIALLNCFDYSGRRVMSAVLVNNVIDNDTTVSSARMVDTIITIVAPLAHDEKDRPSAEHLVTFISKK